MITKDIFEIQCKLFLLALILKLTKTVDWSWWVISAPLWAPFLLIIIFAILLTVASIL